MDLGVSHPMSGSVCMSERRWPTAQVPSASSPSTTVPPILGGHGRTYPPPSSSSAWLRKQLSCLLLLRVVLEASVVNYIQENIARQPRESHGVDRVGQVCTQLRNDWVSGDEKTSLYKLCL